ncbi:acyl-CoA dehydrogenase [Streptomyces lavendofoliae]|uniref:Monooxygenase n=1 Tax=Streptomyces lavendofoliae TaxID=67314 RepID=A0A918I5R1_9ACTN|nr:acyl-CoA dehydrogenase [Streptomyces lavendofoliae]GGU68385.1 monooxygenase [Streptomyces lavendofoliae]
MPATPATATASATPTGPVTDTRLHTGTGPQPAGHHDGGHAALLRTAREVADDLAADAVPRDRAGLPPADETARLREAGLLTALVPPGGAYGVDWRTGCAIVREIATADSSVGELLARHYAHTWNGRFYGTAHRATTLERDTARRQWLWAGGVHSPAPDGSGPGLTLTPLDSGYLLNGRLPVDTAVTVADQFVVDAVCAVTGDLLVVRVRPGRPGVFVEPARDRLGQRLAGAGTVAFDRVTVAPAQVLGPRPYDAESTAPFTALADPALRLSLCHVGLGIAEGALAEARDTSRSVMPPRLPGTAGPGAHDRLPAKDPDLLLAYGELASAAQTAAVVVERATETMARALEAGPHLDVDEPADVAALVATAETVTARAALHITTRVLELADAPGLDRFWRNARVLTAHRPTAHRLRDIGEHYLNGTHRLAAVSR